MSKSRVWVIVVSTLIALVVMSAIVYANMVYDQLEQQLHQDFSAFFSSGRCMGVVEGPLLEDLKLLESNRLSANYARPSVSLFVPEHANVAYVMLRAEGDQKRACACVTLQLNSSQEVVRWNVSQWIPISDKGTF